MKVTAQTVATQDGSPATVYTLEVEAGEGDWRARAHCVSVSLAWPEARRLWGLLGDRLQDDTPPPPEPEALDATGDQVAAAVGHIRTALRTIQDFGGGLNAGQVYSLETDLGDALGALGASP